MMKPPMGGHGPGRATVERNAEAARRAGADEARFGHMDGQEPGPGGAIPGLSAKAGSTPALSPLAEAVRAAAMPHQPVMQAVMLEPDQWTEIIDLALVGVDQACRNHEQFGKMLDAALGGTPVKDKFLLVIDGVEATLSLEEFRAISFTLYQRMTRVQGAYEALKAMPCPSNWSI